MTLKHVVPDSPRRRLALWIFLGVLLVTLVAGMWVGFRGAAAADELSAARSLASRVGQDMTAGNSAKAAVRLEKMGRHTAAALALTSDPVWRAMELIPLAGPNLVAVRESAQAVDDMVTDVATPLLPLTGDLDAGSFAGASIPLQPLIDAAPMARGASEAAEAISARLSQIDAARTLPFIRDAVLELTALVTEVTETVTSIDRATTLLPGMLGVDRPRNYLVLFQNNAELRASGGIPGATAILTVTNGNVSLTAQRSTLDYPRLDEPVLPLTAAETELYGTIMGRWIQDVNLTPDFSRTGGLAKAMAEPIVNMPIDGVLTIDPYVLSYVLAATGPVELADGSILTSDNAVSVLLSDVYSTIQEPADQDRFFASVATKVFDVLTTGDTDPARLLDAIVHGGDEGRIRIWSADAKEQESLAETTMAGVPTADIGSVVGVFLNDATGGKMGYYLHGAISTSCIGTEQRVRVELDSDAPADAATSLPGFVTGNGVYGVPAGSIRTQVLVVLPPGARVVTREDSRRTVVRDGFDRVVVSQFVEVNPGESVNVTVEYMQAPPPTRISTTPGLHVNSPEGGQADCG